MSPQQNSLQKIRKLSGGELSLEARLGYVALLLVAAAMTVVILSLWLTEPFLPARTQVAFGAMTLIGASWMVLSLWALSTRRVLYAKDRVIAGGMAVLFTTVFLAGAVALVVMANHRAAYGAAITGALMVALALRVWMGARRRFTMLSARRAELEGG
jgi:hypothetical protein